MTGFTPPAEPAGTPYYATAALNTDSNQGTQLTITVNNVADQPPHFETDLSARVYFDISSLYAQGQTISSISTPVYYDAADQIDGRPTSISAPVQWGDANSCVYYVTVDWSGDQIGLPPSRAFEFGINAAQGPNYKSYWSSAASPSLTGLAAGTYASTPDPYIPVYAGGKLAYGQVPSTTADEKCVPGGGGGGTGGGGTASVTAAVRDRGDHRGHLHHQQPDPAGQHRYQRDPAVEPDDPVLVHRGRQPARCSTPATTRRSAARTWRARSRWSARR